MLENLTKIDLIMYPGPEPDQSQNLIDSSMGHTPSTHKIYDNWTWYTFLSNLVVRQINKPTKVKTLPCFSAEVTK